MKAEAMSWPVARIYAHEILSGEFHHTLKKQIGRLLYALADMHM